MRLSSIILFVLLVTSCSEPNTKQVVNDRKQEEILWWEHYEKMYLTSEDGESEFS